MHCRDADLSRLLDNNGIYPCKIRVDLLDLQLELL